ncbi:hypothetical protein HZA43_02650 [Candidatus Peregrinibacteria bacterium]|nr:hypothetical protein [Candidatus Peregrinibacteria bacterium]
MDFLQLFKNLGLTDKEPDVYLALLRLPGTQPASVIASHTGLNRTTVYKTLMKLVKMGLAVKTMRHGILCFYAEDPSDRLESIIEARKKQTDALHKNLIEILPDLRQMKEKEMALPKMRYYEGPEGIKRVYEDTLAEEQTIYSFENIETMSSAVHDYIFNDYIPRRIEKEIFAHVITPENKANKIFRKNDKISLRKTKFAPFSIFPVEIEINIYGQKTAFFSYKAEEMFGAILESPSITNSMKAIFNFCWKFAE